jgi:16S rRNA (cytidine1402-2'-O)-methyltransferase
MSKLYIVPTPIGNLKDITLRAIEVLKEVDFILTEDTRTSLKLLQHYSIDKKLIAYHQHNEHQRLLNIVSQIQHHKVALISDAGTPGISDAGYLLVKACLEVNISVETLPGATAFVPALINSGLPCDRFYFHGFLPHKKGRMKHIESMFQLGITAILYESPHRLQKTLLQLSEIYGLEHQISISREISKVYEETIRGTIAEMLAHFNNNEPKGEFVIVLAPADK